MICKKDPVLFPFAHWTYVLDICEKRLSEAVLTNTLNICFLKYQIQCLYIISDNSSLERSFLASQIIIITNLVVVSSIGIKRVDCIYAVLKTDRNNKTNWNQIEFTALTTLVGRLSPNVGWENGPKRGESHLTFNILYFKQTVKTLIRRRVLRRLIWICTVCQWLLWDAGHKWCNHKLSK